MALAKLSKTINRSDLIVDPAWNSRKSVTPPAELLALGDSIKTKGQIAPCVVWMNHPKHKGKPFLIVGFRRVGAIDAAHVKEVVVLEFEGEERDAREMNLRENIARRDIFPGEIAPYVLEQVKDGRKLNAIAKSLAMVTGKTDENVETNVLSQSYMSQLAKIEENLCDEIKPKWRAGRGGIRSFYRLVSECKTPDEQKAFYNTIAPGPEDHFKDVPGYGQEPNPNDPPKSDPKKGADRPSSKKVGAALTAATENKDLDAEIRKAVTETLAWTLGLRDSLTIDGVHLFPVPDKSDKPAPAANGKDEHPEA